VDLDLSEDKEFFRDATREFLEFEIPTRSVRKLADDPAGFERSGRRSGVELGRSTRDRKP
jgi:hypothetical protein